MQGFRQIRAGVPPLLSPGRARGAPRRVVGEQAVDAGAGVVADEPDRSGLVAQLRVVVAVLRRQQGILRAERVGHHLQARRMRIVDQSTAEAAIGLLTQLQNRQRRADHVGIGRDFAQAIRLHHRCIACRGRCAEVVRARPGISQQLQQPQVRHPADPPAQRTQVADLERLDDHRCAPGVRVRRQRIQ
jgi:hypothetical protein